MFPFIRVQAPFEALNQKGYPFYPLFLLGLVFSVRSLGLVEELEPIWGGTRGVTWFVIRWLCGFGALGLLCELTLRRSLLVHFWVAFRIRSDLVKQPARRKKTTFSADLLSQRIHECGHSLCTRDC